VLTSANTEPVAPSRGSSNTLRGNTDGEDSEVDTMETAMEDTEDEEERMTTAAGGNSARGKTKKRKERSVEGGEEGPPEKR